MEDLGPPKRLRLQWRVLTVAKDADYPEENQDAVYVDGDGGAAAIADGVSSTLFARRWATILVEAAARHCPDPDDPRAMAHWLAERRAAWRRQIDVSNLVWFQSVKLHEGAFSTLLVIRLLPPESRSALEEPEWRLHGVSIGDSCLFHLRRGRLLRTFPIQSSAEFDQCPLVLGSVDLHRDEYLAFQRLDEPCQEGDLIVLCTDALAHWALRREEAGINTDWEEYWDIDPTAWKAHILALRSQREIRRDDTTLALLRIVGDEGGQSREERREPEQAGQADGREERNEGNEREDEVEHK